MDDQAPLGPRGLDVPYRADLDGLRALAIVAVLAYHAFPKELPGGYVGVDIFFVISGFLIASLIRSQIVKERFTVLGFYGRRVRRILPALALILAVSLVVGYFVLFPNEYRNLGVQSVAGAAFFANLAAWRDTGYFDLGALRKPLLHLWSLGIEEQFYFVWPLLLWLARRHTHQALAWISAVAVASFALNLAAVFILHNTSLAFYLPLTRIWELALGSLLAYSDWPRDRSPIHQRFGALSKLQAFCERPLPRNLCAFTGLLFIGFALVALRPGFAYPGWFALLPVVGTMLLILTGRDSWLGRQWFSHRVAVYVGLISYPLYLWHWPLLCYARLVWRDSRPLMAMVIGASFLLAILTYHGIERPIRGTSRRRRLATFGLLAANGAFALIGLFVARGMLHRDPPADAKPIIAAIGDHDFPSGDAFDRSGALLASNIISGNPSAVTLYIGDSHLQQYWPRLRELPQLRPAGLNSIYFAAHSGCPPLPEVSRIDADIPCARFFDQAMRLADDPRVKTVVFAAWWEWYFMPRPGETEIQEPVYLVTDQAKAVLTLDRPDAHVVFDAFEATVSRLIRSGKKVVIVLSNPTSESFSPASMVRRVTYRRTLAEAVSRAAVLAQTAPMTDRLRGLARRSGAVIVDPLDYQCNLSVCPTTTTEGVPLYSDSNHMRPFFVRELDYLDLYNY